MKPKLLLVSDTYHPQVDGTVIFIDEFIKRAQKSFDITLLAPRFPGKKKKDSVRSILLDTSKFIEPLPTYPSIKFTLKNLRKIKTAIQQADIVFAQGPAALSYLAMYYGHKFKKKVIAFTHVLSWELFAKSKNALIGLTAPFLKKLCVFFYNYCTEILVPYQDLRLELKKEGIRSEMTIARLGVDINRFSPSKDIKGDKRRAKLTPDQFVVGYVGRLSPEKNVGVIREAFEKLDDKEMQLLIVGDGSEEQRRPFEKLSNCTITGFVPNVEDYLKAMDLFIMPSLTETTSLATLEAMSCGLPVISTRLGFMKHYITKGHNGLFFPRNNSLVLSLKIKKLRDQEEMRQSLGRNARRTIAYSFSWERSINKIARILLKHR